MIHYLGKMFCGPLGVSMENISKCQVIVNNTKIVFREMSCIIL